MVTPTQSEGEDRDTYRNPGLPIMLLEAEGSARRVVGQVQLNLNALVELNAAGLP